MVHALLYFPIFFRAREMAHWIKAYTTLAGDSSLLSLPTTGDCKLPVTAVLASIGTFGEEHTHIHEHIHIYSHSYTQTHTHIHMHSHIHTLTHTNTQIHTCKKNT